MICIPIASVVWSAAGIAFCFLSAATEKPRRAWWTPIWSDLWYFVSFNCLARAVIVSLNRA